MICYRKLVDKANEWLYKNAEVQVRCCETVTWMSHDAKLLGDGENMLLTQSIEDNGTTSCLRGFRYHSDNSLCLTPVKIKMCHFFSSYISPLFVSGSHWGNMHCISYVCPSIHLCVC